MNAFGTYERMALALGVESLDEFGENISELIDFSRYFKAASAVKSVHGLTRLLSAFPVKMPTAPCQEVVEEPDLDTLPILKCWPGDAGKLMTLPLVFTKDPETGTQNVGMYRLQVYDKRTTGMHWHLHKDGARDIRKVPQAGRKDAGVGGSRL